MPVLNLNHFQMSLLFALLASVILGLTVKGENRERVRYGAQCFGWFVLALFGIGWAMRILHG